MGVEYVKGVKMKKPSDRLMDQYQKLVELKELEPNSSRIRDRVGISGTGLSEVKNWIDEGVNMNKPSDNILEKYNNCKRVKEQDPSKSLASIWRECKISAGSFYEARNWERYQSTGELPAPTKPRNKPGPKIGFKKEPSMVTIPVSEPSKLVALIGSHDQVISAIRELM